jgi:hypothetical protein
MGIPIELAERHGGADGKGGVAGHLKAGSQPHSGGTRPGGGWHPFSIRNRANGSLSRSG